MRKYENQLDQENARRKQLALQEKMAAARSPASKQEQVIEGAKQEQQQPMGIKTKIQGQAVHASAEAALNSNEFKSTTVSAFPDMV